MVEDQELFMLCPRKIHDQEFFMLCCPTRKILYI